MCEEPNELDRDTYIREKVLTALAELSQDALYWGDTPTDGINTEPLWCELRDTIVSVLFDMDREQHDAEIYAEHVREYCL